MKNDECIIYMTTKGGSTQIYRKDKDGWKQKSSKGIVRKMTAEQLLSHLLPALTAEYTGKVWLRIERIKKKKKDSKKKKS